MDWLGFLASLVTSVAWPVTVIALALLLRDPITKLQPALNRLKYKDLELQFGKEVAEARAEIEASEQVKGLPEIRRIEVAPNAGYLTALTEISPRAAVLEAWLPFEVAIGRIAERLDLTDRGRPLQMPRLLEALATQGVLTSDEARVVNRLREIRNKVVHAQSVDLEPGAINEFARVLSEMASAMEARLAAIAQNAAQQAAAPGGR